MVDIKALKPPPKVKYLVTHPGPNRALRRRIAALRHIQRKRLATWRRELIRAGVDPDQVLLRREIKAQLKMLFRRYNRSASSLDARLRGEADQMLDAIVQMREKHFGEI